MHNTQFLLLHWTMSHLMLLYESTPLSAVYVKHSRRCWFVCWSGIHLIIFHWNNCIALGFLGKYSLLGLPWRIYYLNVNCQYPVTPNPAWAFRIVYENLESAIEWYRFFDLYLLTFYIYIYISQRTGKNLTQQSRVYLMLYGAIFMISYSSNLKISYSL